MRNLRIWSTLALLLALGRTASAQDDVEMGSSGEESASPGSDLGNFVIGVHIGPSLSVFSDLDAHVLPRLELGYNLPPWGRRMEVFATGAYTRPSASGRVTDTRLPNEGSFTWDLSQDELSIGVGLLVRLFELGRFINPYAAVGPQVVLLRTTVNGKSGGESFGEQTEQDTKFGVFGALGVDIVLGPGALFVELGISWSDLHGQITGDSNTGNLSPSVGYRLML